MRNISISKSTVYYWAPVWFWMIAIFVASSIPSAKIQQSEVAGTLVVSAPLLANQFTIHVTEYGILALLLYRLIFHTRIMHPATIWFFAVVSSVLYGISDELHQSFVPGRYPGLIDLGYDAMGAILGASSALLATKVINRLRNSYTKDGFI